MSDQKNNNTDRDLELPRATIIALSLIQGILLTVLYRSYDAGVWPASSPVWFTAIVTFVIAFPLLTLMCITQRNQKTVVMYTLLFSGLLSLLGAYVGFQQTPVEYINNHDVLAIFIVTSLLASYKALMYLQQHLSSQAISYSSLFKLSWRNFIIFVECWLFVGVFWGILNLGAGLFKAVEITFFSELLREDWFVIPVLNLAFGFAIIVFRNIVHTADTIATILQNLMKFLLPALSVVSIGFLLTLLFTGLETLWKTGSGTLLVMWLMLLTLFFVNAVYQDESHKCPYGSFLHRLITLGVAVLPAYSVIAAYGLWLRVEQYGFTVDRLWAWLLWGLITCFVIGYLVGIVKKREDWLETLSMVNVRMGIVVMSVCLLVNSPVLNFQSIAANSQMARIYSGDVAFSEFDFSSFERQFGRQGYLLIEELKRESSDLTDESLAIIERMYVNREVARETKNSKEDFLKRVVYWPDADTFPLLLVDAVYEDIAAKRWLAVQNMNVYFVAKDLNRDGEPEYVVIKESNFNSTAHVWFLGDEGWYSKYMSVHNPQDNRFIKTLLENNDIGTQSPTWDTLTIGTLRLSLPPDEQVN